MRPHPRIRKTIKWGCGLSSLTLLVAFFLSLKWTAGYSGRPGLEVMHPPGRLTFFWNEGKVRHVGYNGWTIEASESGLYWWVNWGRAMQGPFLRVPSWMLITMTGACSALAWRLDTLATRRAKLGACPTCSYPRTGLAPAAPCPECGAAAPQA